MNKLLMASLLFLTLQGCFNTDIKNEELKSIKEDIEQIKESEQVKLEEVLKDKKEIEKEKELEQEIKEKDELLQEIEDLKKEVKEKPKVKINKFGPGNASNLQGEVDGYVKIHTRSANGKLTLRDSPDQSGNKVLEIVNGTDDIYYSDRIKVGEYVWYKVEYLGSIGYLRGDYLYRY